MCSVEKGNQKKKKREERMIMIMTTTMMMMVVYHLSHRNVSTLARSRVLGPTVPRLAPV